MACNVCRWWRRVFGIHMYRMTLWSGSINLNSCFSVARKLKAMIWTCFTLNKLNKFVQAANWVRFPEVHEFPIKSDLRPFSRLIFLINLHYYVIQRAWMRDSFRLNYKIARNYLAHMLNFIVMEMNKVNREKGYYTQKKLSQGPFHTTPEEIKSGRFPSKSESNVPPRQPYAGRI